MWHLAGAEGTDSLTHFDAHGLGTIIMCVEGYKLWGTESHAFSIQEVFKVVQFYAQDEDTRNSPANIVHKDAVLMQAGDYL